MTDVTSGPRSRLPVLATRTAWLMLGAAIGLAVGLVAVTLGQVVAQWTGVPAVVPTAVVALASAGLAWLPGIGDLEVTAARGLLGVRAPLTGGMPPTPGDATAAPPTPQRRARLAVWVVAHLASGLIGGFVLLGLLPGAGVVAIAALSGQVDPIGAAGLPEPTTPALRLLTATLAVLAAAACLAGVVALGAVMARLAPPLLGPTTADRLALAEARSAADAEHLRLARELHDGIGHALTLIGIQAAAARRTPGPRPESVGTALQVVEDTSRQALEELDTMLAVLRRPDGEPVAVTSPATPGLDRLDALLAAHRQAGMTLVVAVPDPATVSADVPPPISRAAYRIVAEGLTNAARHGTPGEVRVRVDRDPRRLRLSVDNPAGRGRARGGHGLEGVAERVRLVGGELQVGPTDDHRRWRLEAELPLRGGTSP